MFENTMCSKLRLRTCTYPSVFIWTKQRNVCIQTVRVDMCASFQIASCANNLDKMCLNKILDKNKAIKI